MWAVMINNKYTFPGLIIPASYIANYTYTCKAIIQDAVLDFSIVDIKKIIAREMSSQGKLMNLVSTKIILSS